MEKNCHAWGKPLPKNCVLPQHAGFYRVRWLWGLGQTKSNAKGCHTLVQQNLLPWPRCTPSFSLASLLHFRLMHALPRSSWFISGPDSSLQYECGHCPVLVPDEGGGIICHIPCHANLLYIVRGTLLCYHCKCTCNFISNQLPIYKCIPLCKA